MTLYVNLSIQKMHFFGNETKQKQMEVLEKLNSLLTFWILQIISLF